MPTPLFRYKMNDRGLQQYSLHSRPLQRAIDRRAVQGLRIARILAPRESGQLRDTMHLRKHVVRTDRYGLRYGVQIRTGVPYAAAIELGRKRGVDEDGNVIRDEPALFMTDMAKALNTPKREKL